MPTIHRVIFALTLLTVGTYCVFYWTSDYQDLASWYKSLNPYFYNAALWESELFTPSVKKIGNWWCLAAILSAVAMTALYWKASTPSFPKLNIHRQHYREYGLIVVSGATLSLAINWDTLYTSDEVFSALNFASLTSFQCISNYPKPNNHLFLNFLNGLVFSFSKDLVLTGRILSLACYCLTLCFTWHFLKKWLNESWLRGLILLVLAVQFPALGFSWQARGYEMVLLCSCVSLFSFIDYFSEYKNTALLVHILSNLVGIFTLPTYLYWWSGLLLAAIIIQVIQRKIDVRFIKATTTCMAISMIQYLPLLTISGLASLSENKYVKGEQVSQWHFLTHLNKHHYFDNLFAEWFCVDGSSLVIVIALLVAVISLIFNPSSHHQKKALGIAYISIVLAFIGMAVLLLKLPFYRNLIAHGYLSLMVLVLAIVPLFNSKGKRYILGILLFTFAVFSIKTNVEKLPNNLYYYDVDYEYKKNQAIELELDITKPIYLDYEDFYWWYVLKKRYPEYELIILPNHPHPTSSETLHPTSPYQLLE